MDLDRHPYDRDNGKDVEKSNGKMDQQHQFEQHKTEDGGRRNVAYSSSAGDDTTSVDCSICQLYNWRYKKLGNLPHVSLWPEFRTANAGFFFDFQLINVEDFNGIGESEPNPYFYQVSTATLPVMPFGTNYYWRWCFVYLVYYPYLLQIKLSSPKKACSQAQI